MTISQIVQMAERKSKAEVQEMIWNAKNKQAECSYSERSKWQELVTALYRVLDNK
jgi:hypothetical protein